MEILSKDVWQQICNDLSNNEKFNLTFLSKKLRSKILRPCNFTKFTFKKNINFVNGLNFFHNHNLNNLRKINFYCDLKNIEINEKSIYCLHQVEEVNFYKKTDFNILKLFHESKLKRINIVSLDVNIFYENLKEFLESQYNLEQIILNVYSTQHMNIKLSNLSNCICQNKNLELLSFPVLGNNDYKKLISNCPSLNTINIIPRTDKIISINSLNILSNNKLKSIGFSNKPLIIEIIKILSVGWKKITNLAIRKCDLTDEHIKIITNNCTKLNFLNIRCNKITDKSIKYISENCKDISNLCIDYDSDKKITDKCIPYLNNIEKLSELTISMTGNININFNCKNLKKLRIISKTINNKNLINMSKNSNKLKYLYIFNCVNKELTDEGIIELSKNCPELRCVNIPIRNHRRNQHNVDGSFLNKIYGNCPKYWRTKK